MEAQHIHSLSVESALEQLGTHLHQGLTAAEAKARLEKYGFNELMEKPRPGFLKVLWEQFEDFLVRILIIAAIVSLFLGEMVDASAIMAIVILNAVLGVVQQAKAEQALAALKKMASPSARVVRDGVETTVPARELVPGDIVLLEAGNYVPADMRLIESVNLKIEEASLTGESVPVNKNARVVLDKEIPIGDRKNSAFMSTLVTYGRGKGLVTHTGMRTQLGMIAEMIQSYEEEPTPLQLKLDQLGKWLGIVSLAICGLVFVYGVIRDTHPGMVLTQGLLEYLRIEQKDIIELFMTAVSLAIAAVPEGLPAVVTICLALGMQRMVRRHALIRKLPAVETLGCATVICSDKTGTLTQNQMTVVRGWADGKTFQVTGEGYQPVGTFSLNGQPFDPRRHPVINFLLHGALLCNDARLERSGEENGHPTYRMVGDPTEGALVVAAAKAGLWREDGAQVLPRVNEIPFDAERKRMTTVHQITDLTGLRDLPGLDHSSYIGFVKGAPDIMLECCDSILADGMVQPLTEAQRQEILAANADMARQALRVLGVAYRPLSQVPETPGPEDVEKHLVFVGLMGMIDPARAEVKSAVAVAQGAGLKSVMVTGDYKDTAEAIAREIGMLTPAGKVLTGAELDQMTEEQLAEIVERVDVYARVSPTHKMKIVGALKERGHVVAMTGDGVNDAPALKRANIGVAMGITGTDVAKETADMVLTDDNYASIVSAIEEGRIIYSNIRKFVFYLISCNIGEILIIFLSMLAGLPIPLRPIQLLWLNLVTDGAPALALGLEKGDPDTMKRPPRPTKEPVINREMLIGVIVQAIVMTAAVLTAFVYGLDRYPDNLADAQTVTFATLIVSELLRAYTARSERYSLFSIGVFGNKWMQYAVGSSLVLLLAVIYAPFLQPFFGTIPLTLEDWLVMTPLFLVSSVAAEITKAVLRRRAQAGAVVAAARASMQQETGRRI
ncbi:MAG: calcium-translocating P-type ATPase, SERCA-type [Anaerolineae bacterium]